MTSFVSHLSCPRCGRRHDHREPHGLCACGSPLLVEYDLDAVGRAVTTRDLADRPPTMWRYRELLPVDDPDHVVSLGEGFTPLLRAETLASLVGVADLWVKDEGLNPTGTFKARGASAGVSRALDLRISDVALATAGNAGGAWACYGAAAGIGVHVAVPSEAPPITGLECGAYGADVIEVEGHIGDAAAALDVAAGANGWFDVSGLREPYRLDGKRTLGFEIAEQLSWRRPDAIVYPTGGGVGLIGIWRAWRQMRELGWVEGGLPRMIAVQSDGCAPVVRAFEEGADQSRPWKDAGTVASGLLVPKALGDALTLRAIRETGGTAVAVPDRTIVEMVGTMARESGVLPSPEAAATLAGAIALRKRGDLGGDDEVVLVSTGSGLKYPDVLSQALRDGGG